MIKNIFHLIAGLQESGESFALCTIVATNGSTPRHVGSKMLVYNNGDFFGTVGGGELEHRVLDEAWVAITDGKPRKLFYSMTDPANGDVGVCGGQVEVFVEPFLPAPRIIIIGGGHVGKAVAHLAKWSGFRVAVSDDRSDFCTEETNPDADEFFPVTIEQLPAQTKITKQTYFVLTTRGVGIDIPGLPFLLKTNASYIGVIGSRRRWSVTVKGLKEQGISDEQIARIHAPIGLELNAETPEEIAISIMAEIIMLRNKGNGKQMAV